MTSFLATLLPFAGTALASDEPTAQASVQRPGPQSLRAEEDWGPFGRAMFDGEGTPASPGRALDRIKYVPLGGNSYLSLGGQARVAYEFYRAENFGVVPQDDSGALVIRGYTHADLRINQNFRGFLQLKATGEVGRDGGPLGVNAGGLDIHQGFLEVATGEDTRWSLRIGRQEFLYGAGRIVDVRDGLANRRSFDALHARMARSRLSIDALAGFEVAIRPGVFDDGVPVDDTPSPRFWGAIAQWAPFDSDTFDLYYFGVEEDGLVYAEGTGDELRHSVGLRYARTVGRIVPDVEFIGQWGQLDIAESDVALDILSFALEGTVSFIVAEQGWRPEVMLGMGYVSGDMERGDGVLGTHRAPFPNLRFAGATSFIGPGNGYGANVRFIVRPSKRSQVQAIYRGFYRASLADATYTSFGVPQRVADSDARYVGSSISLVGFVVPAPGASLYATAEYFEPGAYVKAAPPAERSAFFTVGSKFWF